MVPYRNGNIDRAFRRTAAVLTERGAAVVVLFGPEHGYHGAEQAGVPVAGGERAAATGTPIHSLYSVHDGDAHVFDPPAGSLDGLDALVFDVQDVGARYYTYPTTLGILMERAPLPIVVIDRPNPIGGALVEGPTLDPAFRSFVGRYPVPVRHGLTLGELATLINDRFLDGHADLTVVPMEGWRRGILFDATALRLYPEPFTWLPAHFDCLTGSDGPRRLLTESGGDAAALPSLFARWERDEGAFRSLRRAFLRY